MVEDHLYHITELLAALAAGAPALPDQMCVFCLERRGPDTTRAVAAWLNAHPGLQVAAAVDPGELAVAATARGRFLTLAPALFASANRLCQALAAALRPGGLLLQDIQLSTLEFVPAERWWESIYLAATVRGLFSERPPASFFFSNKRGYEATFGRELLEAGFDPRDVADKSDLAGVVVPVLRTFLDRRFPLVLRLAAAGSPAGGGSLPPAPAVARDEGDRQEVESELDLVLWRHGGGALELGGRALAPPPAARPEGAPAPLATETGRRRLALKDGSQEARTWERLFEDRLAGGGGVPVLEVGQRLAPESAGRAEVTNLAARHLHTLRGRLRDGAAILTERHAYRLSERLAVGVVLPRA